MAREVTVCWWFCNANEFQSARKLLGRGQGGGNCGPGVVCSFCCLSLRKKKDCRLYRYQRKKAHEELAMWSAGGIEEPMEDPKAELRQQAAKRPRRGNEEPAGIAPTSFNLARGTVPDSRRGIRPSRIRWESNCDDRRKTVVGRRWGWI